MKVIYDKKHLLHNPEMCHPGHPEVSKRAENILHSVREAGHNIISPKLYDLDVIQTVHSIDYIKYLSSSGGKRIVEKDNRYCFADNTPILENTFDAARASANCALTGADLLIAGEPKVYALCRPPGHHSGNNYCLGFCYFNNAALAAKRLSDNGKNKIAILDVDYHHGNGTQDIFYESNDVLYVSIHADPNFAFPHRWGFSEETGMKAGKGFNINFPLPMFTKEFDYLDILNQALEIINNFNADFLIVSFGADTFTNDPLGTFELSEDSFTKLGGMVQRLNLPTLVIQEGGYNLDSIGTCVTNFLKEKKSK